VQRPLMFDFAIADLMLLGPADQDVYLVEFRFRCAVVVARGQMIRRTGGSRLGTGDGPGRSRRDADCHWRPDEPDLLHRHTDRHGDSLNGQGAAGHHRNREHDLRAPGETGTLPQQRQPEWSEDEEQQEHDRPRTVVPLARAAARNGLP